MSQIFIPGFDMVIFAPCLGFRSLLTCFLLSHVSIWSMYCCASTKGWESRVSYSTTLLIFFWFCMCACSLTHVWLCATPPGSSVHGIFQARILEWVATSSSRGSSWPRDRSHVSGISCTGRQILYHWVTWETHYFWAWPSFKVLIWLGWVHKG